MVGKRWSFAVTFLHFPTFDPEVPHLLLNKFSQLFIFRVGIEEQRKHLCRLQII